MEFAYSSFFALHLHIGFCDFLCLHLQQNRRSRNTRTLNGYHIGNVTKFELKHLLNNLVGNHMLSWTNIIYHSFCNDTHQEKKWTNLC